MGVFLLLAPLLVCPRALTPGEAPGSAALLSTITTEEVLEHVKFLASDDLRGRESGSEGERKAAEYIAERFRTWGLEPAGTEGSYLQPFEIPLGKRAKLGPENRLTVEETVPLPAGGKGGGVGRAAFPPRSPRGDAGVGYPAGKAWNPFSFSPSREASGPLLFAGYGIVWEAEGYDDYAGVEARGKVVLVLRHSPGEARTDSRWKGKTEELGTFTRKVRLAEERGAAALIMVNDPNNHPGEDVLVSPDLKVRRGRSRIPVIFLKRSIADRWLEEAGTSLTALQTRIDGSLAPASREIPGLRITVATEVGEEDLGQGRSANVAARLIGSDPALKEEAVLVGAHYDHVGEGRFGSLSGETGRIHNGADDNASGVAALLEIAQALAGAPSRPARTILFVAFGAEERGLLGSRHAVEHPLWPLERTAAMINLDMVGRLEGKRLTVMGAGTAESFRDDLQRWSAGADLPVEPQDRFSDDSDHASYGRKQVPVLFLTTGLHPDYHRPGDDWEKVDLPGAARAARLACLAALDLASRPGRPAYRDPRRSIASRERGVEQPPREERRGGAFLGIVPAQAAELAGVVVREVSEGGPAALAGLLTGDTVVSVGGKRIATIEDLIQALASRAPGEEVEVEVIRKVKVKLGEKR